MGYSWHTRWAHIGFPLPSLTVCPFSSRLAFEPAPRDLRIRSSGRAPSLEDLRSRSFANLGLHLGPAFGRRPSPSGHRSAPSYLGCPHVHPSGSELWAPGLRRTLEGGLPSKHLLRGAVRLVRSVTRMNRRRLKNASPGGTHQSKRAQGCFRIGRPAFRHRGDEGRTADGGWKN